MEQILKNGDIIELDGKDYYYVVARTTYEGEEYADVVKYPEDAKDLLHEEKLERKVVKVTIKGEEVFVDTVEDPKIQAKLRKLGDSKVKPVKRVRKA